MADFNPYDSWTVQSPWSYGEDVTLDEVVQRVANDPEASVAPIIAEALDAPVEDAPAPDAAPVEETPVEAPVDVPADPAPVDAAPVDVPADPAPVVDAPVDPAPPAE